ncbi:MAG: Mrp/NBP35 family ATP-binding protein [Bacillota bacterium]|nr:Mrp/NBP35 family ATP-binding protein [Bacillota bacterium]
MSECTHDCSSCSGGCSIEKDKPNEYSNIKHIVGVISGKGGVGKSTVTASLAALLARKGYKVGILDADITGPSIPRLFGVSEKAKTTEDYMFPAVSHNGIKVMSVNLLLPNENDPVVWRGPVISGVIRQFYKDVAWDELDYLFVDMPPGTGDAILTAFQYLPLEGVIIVTTPQSLVEMIVKKAEAMAEMMNIPILGYVENMSYVKCPDCGKEIDLFGKSGYDYKNKLLSRMPLDSEAAKLADSGKIEMISHDYLDKAVEALENIKE